MQQAGSIDIPVPSPVTAVMETPKCKSEVTGLDSGWSWVIAAACCFTNCMLYGVSRLSGMLLHPAVETYGVSRGAAALPFTTSSAVRNFSGPIVGFLGQHFGIRPVAAVGCVLASLGAGLCFFTTNIFWTTVCWGGIFGIGFGLSTSLLPSAINQNFDKYTATASGISYSGSYIGSFIFPAVVLFLLDKYTLPGTFLVLSGFILNSLVAVVLLKPPRLHDSTSNSKPVYTVGSKRDSTDPSLLQEIRIDEFDVRDPNRRQCRVTDQIKPKENENLQENVCVPERIDIFRDKTETFDQVLGFLTTAKNSNFPDSFPVQEQWKMQTAEKEQHKFFMNLPVKDIILKIYDHITSSKNHSFNFSEKRAKIDTLHLELNDSEKNNYLLLQLSDQETEVLLTELKNEHCDRLANESCGDLTLWGIFREYPHTPESKSLTRLQKFTKRKMLSGYDIVNIPQNASGLQNLQAPYHTIARGNLTSKIHQCLGLETQKSAFQKPRSKSLLARLTQSFKDRNSTARAGPLGKSFSLDSGSDRPATVESLYPLCFVAVAVHAYDSKKSKEKIYELSNAPAVFPSSEPSNTSATLDNTGKFIFEIHNLPYKCAPLRISVDEVPSHIIEEHFANSHCTIAFSSKERLFKDVDVTSPPHLLQLKCVAIILLRNAQNSGTRDLNFRFSSSKDSAANLNSQNINFSGICPDQNQNFLDPVDKAENVENSKAAHFSVILVNKEAEETRYPIMRTRLRSWCSVFSNPMFLLISVTMAVYSFVMVCIITVIEDYARDIEHPSIPKPYLLMVLSAADLCGTLGLGWITDRGFLTKKTFIAICFFGMAISVMAIAFTAQMIALCILVAIYGMFESGIVITFPLLTAQFIRVDKQTIAIASSNLLSAPAILLVPFVIGYFRDYMGSYHKLFYLLSVASCACALLWVLVPYLLQKYTLKFKGRFS